MNARRPATGNPYVGPRPFLQGERLYGRDQEVLRLFDLLIARRIVLVYSPSGAGKTSLLQAKLVPRLIEEGLRVLPVIRVGLEPPSSVEYDGRGPGRYVLSALHSLEEALPEDQRWPESRLAETEVAAYLDGLRERVGGTTDFEVLIFDQFEEILTLDPTDREAKETFFAQVGAVLRDPGRWAVFSLREDHVAGLDPYLRRIPTRLGTRFRLDLLDQEAARLAIQGPARDAGVDFTEAAARRLVDDLRRVRVQQADGTTEERLGPHLEPVQLQVVCRQLWEQLAHAGERFERIEPDHVAALGNVDDALGAYYAEAVAAVAAETGVPERDIRTWFHDHLITKQGVRGQVLREPGRSAGLDDRAIRRLIDAHLVRAEPRRGATWFELAHDRLIDPVRASNNAWFPAHLSALQLQAKLWHSRDRASGYLLSDEALEEAERWAAEHDEQLTSVERDFLRGCRDRERAQEAERRLRDFEAAQRLAAQQARANRRLLRLLFGTAILGALALGAAVAAFYGFNLAASQRDEAEAQSAMAATAEAQAERQAVTASMLALVVQAPLQHELGQDERGALLARQAYLMDQRLGGSFRNEVDGALRSSLTVPFSDTVLGQHGGPVSSVAFSPDGRLLATAGGCREPRADGSCAAGEVLLWKLDRPQAPTRPSQLPAGEVESVAFDPTGRFLAAAGGDELIHLWDPTDPAVAPTLLPGHAGPVLTVAFSPDGRLLASGGTDGTVRLWDLTQPDADSAVLPGSGSIGVVEAVAFSHDGRLLAAGGDDSPVLLWDPAQPAAAPEEYRRHNGLGSLDFGPDGTLATADFDLVRLWKPGLDGYIVPTGGNSGSFTVVSLSLDGRLLAADAGGVLRLWDASRLLAPPTVLRGHTGSVNSLDFSPDGRVLATGSDSGEVRLWNMVPGVLAGHEAGVTAVAFGPDGRLLASGGFDGTVRLWDPARPEAAPAVLSGHEGQVFAVAFSPDGRLLASGGTDGTVRLRDLARPDAAPAVLSGHIGRISSVAFSPDGAVLASAGEDGTVRLWDPARPEAAPAVLSGHEGQVFTVAFGPDERLLATGGDDGTVRLWDLARPDAATRVLAGHDGAVWSVAFGPDGGLVASAGYDALVRLWITRTETLADLVCQSVRRNLTMEEWTRFVGETIPYEATCPNLPPSGSQPAAAQATPVPPPATPVP